MVVTRKIPNLLGIKPNSIGFEALIAIGWRMSLIITILSFGSYFLLQQLLEAKVISNMEIATEARAHREGELFRNIEQANENARRTLTNLLDAQEEINAVRFEDTFVDYGDNTYRSRDSIYDGTVVGGGLFIKGSAGFVPNASDITTADKKLLSAAIQTVTQTGTAYYPQFESYYFFTPTGQLFIWAPDRAGNLMFYRKEAPSDFSIKEFEVVRITLPENNPERSFVCTDLQPVIDESIGTTWTRGCHLPFDYNGEHVGGFGSSQQFRSVLNAAEDNPTIGGEHMIISTDGKLVEHPRLMKPGQDIEKNLNIATSGNEDIKAIYKNIEKNQDDKTWVTFLHETDSYIAASEIYGLGGYYIISYPRSLIAAEASAAAFNILYLGLIAMVIAMITLSITMKKTVTEPLNQLMLRTKQLSLGKFKPNEVGQKEAGSEISALAASTEKMASELSQIVNNLEQTVNKRTKDLAAARDEAQQASAAKTVFLANMSHEIRTPLTGVIGMLDLLAEENLNPSAISYLGMAQKSSGLLLNLVNDILDISRLEAGKYSVRLSAINLSDAVKDTADSLTLLAKQKQLSLAIKDDLPDNFWVLTDIKIIRQVLINLIGNAIKFTERGGITVALNNQSDEEGIHQITLDVIDTGKGLTPEQSEALFERFEQVDNDDEQATKGTGLGLAIVKELTALLGGTISCNSTPGEGTCFSVAIPMKSSAPAQNTAPAVTTSNQKPLSGIKILAVDDNPINRVIIEKVCLKMGADITLVDSGANMIAELGGNDGDTTYDVLLMDINMPGLSGIETLAAIRALTGRVAKLPAIALTADAIEGTEERMKQAGMNGYVTKPIDADILQTAILETVKNAKDA
ncbi:ATP-binding protein [Kordiimonas aquimaris]|uniref:ATP-binding protein n=1 Tax=Kordiimonas aquimaris TaxID=707591 RepID=UPI0021D21934|nr:ATP-binding protein [Kordiimonas aquimaris]